MGAKSNFSNLRTMYRLVDFRRFRAMNRDNRWADVLGMGPNHLMVGWWNDTKTLVEFEPDAIEWTNMTRYL